jgi:uncharacterized repeat protein (TIGR04052 family)
MPLEVSPRRALRALLLSSTLLLSVAATSSAGQMTAPVTDDRPIRSDSLVAITVRFRGVVDTAAFSCGTRYANIGTSKASVIASDFRFYVHDVRLVTRQGDTVRVALRPESPWQDRDVALLDFENGAASCANGTPETRDAVVVMAPPNDYRGVVFALGVPFARNHEDLASAPPPLSLSQLFWAWQSGHKFLRVDLRATAADSAATPWVIHLGSTGCTKATPTATGPASCAHPNRATVSLPGFDPATDVVIADLASLLSRADVRRNQPATAAGCMSADTDRDCGALFSSLGLTHSAGTGDDTPRFFRIAQRSAMSVGASK